MSGAGVSEADKTAVAWARVHADACRDGDVDLRRIAVSRIAYWLTEAGRAALRTEREVGG